MIRKNIEIESINISYLISGNGKPILFFHGGGTEARTYLPIIKYLSKKNKVISPDIPFFGKSDSPNKIFSFDDFSNLFSKFITLLNLKDVTVIGYSFGGGIAARLAKKKEVKKIILCSPAILNLGITKTGLIKLILTEFFCSMRYIKKKEHFKLFLIVVYDFIKNIIACKNKGSLISSVLMCLNTETLRFDARKTFFVFSNNDPIFSKEQYFKLLGNNYETYDVVGSHLWFLMYHDCFENVYKGLNY